MSSYDIIKPGQIWYHKAPIILIMLHPQSNTAANIMFIMNGNHVRLERYPNRDLRKSDWLNAGWIEA